ncbi:MAG: hypothetical protein AB1405_07085, partial [Bdellovibrionota bacterium]
AVLLDGALLPGGAAETLEDVLPPENLKEGENFLEVVLSGASGEQMVLESRFVRDQKAPRIEWHAPLSGEWLSSLSPKVEILDETAVTAKWGLDGSPLDAGQTIRIGKASPGPHEICVNARDAAGNETTDCREFVLDEKPFAPRRSESDPRASPASPLRSALLDPLLADLVRTGLMGDLFLSSLGLFADATSVFYPEMLPHLEELRRVVGEQARGGDLAAQMRNALRFYRDENWPEAEELLRGFLSDESSGRSPLARLVVAGDAFFPEEEQNISALDRFLGAAAVKEGGLMGLLPLFLDSLASQGEAPWKDFATRARDGISGEFAPALSRLGKKIVTASDGKPSILDETFPVGEALVAERGGLSVGWGALVESLTLPDSRDRAAFQEMMAAFVDLLSSPEILASIGELVRSSDVTLDVEWLRRSLGREDFAAIFRPLSRVSLRPDPRNPGSIVLDSSVESLARLFRPDRRSPGETYASTLAKAIGMTFQKGKDGRSTAEDFIEMLEKLTPVERRQLGWIFVRHSKKGGRPLDPFEDKVSTDAERLMRMFKLANSPLNCGAPVPFTDKVVPLNVPGLPMLFPTDNLITELMEAGTAFDEETVIQMAQLLPKLVSLFKLADVFCEPNIVGDILADIEVIEESLQHPRLGDLLRLSRRMTLRKQHHAVVRMLTAVADSDVLPPAVPFLATLYQTNASEELFEFIPRQRSWRLSNGADAFSHVLAVSARNLGPRPDGRVPLAEIVSRFGSFFSADRLPPMNRVLRHLSQRMVMQERQAGLGRLDLLFGKFLEADAEARGARALGELLREGEGGLIDVVRKAPRSEGSGSPLWKAMPFLVADMEKRGAAPAFFDAMRAYFRIERQSGGSLSWLVRNSFRDSSGSTPFLETARALSPIFAHQVENRGAWTAWSRGGAEGMFGKVLMSTRIWTRPRPSGPPHLIRIRPLLHAAASLPMPSGKGGLAIDGTARILAKSMERGSGKTFLETIDLLDQRGYLDRREPNLGDWIAEGMGEEGGLPR